MNTQGIIFGLQRFCVHDGPGIRTNVFLKGCNLRCAWCHNPESLDKQIRLSYKADRCIRCGRCAAVCKRNVHIVINDTHEVQRENCEACGTCCDACPAEALELIGERITVKNLVEEIRRDRLFFADSSGGLTVSGGEPMMQYDFLKCLLHEVHAEAIGTAIETNGSFPWPMYKALLDDLDILLVDFKHYDTDEHKKWTGIGNEAVLENLRELSSACKPVILRCPIIPGVNDSQAHFQAIAELTRKYGNIRYAELMPYHSLGIHKASEIGIDRTRAFEVPKTETVREWKNMIRRFGGRLKEEFQ